MFEKIKFYIERKYLYIFLLSLTIISLICVILTSNDPIIGFFKGSIIEKIVQKFSFTNSFIYDISIGFLVSVIFYFIVVYIPQRQKQKDTKIFIESKCICMIYISYELINSIVKKSKLDYAYKTLTKDQFLEICKLVNPKESRFDSPTILDYKLENSGYNIYNNWILTVKEIEEILKFLPYIDSGLLKRIYILYNCSLGHFVKDLAYTQNMLNTNLEAWSSMLFDFYLKSKDLRDYFKLYSKNEFESDPWK